MLLKADQQLIVPRFGKPLINDSRDFAETDKFSYDAEIIIAVHTREGKGCEDITEIAD